MTTDLKSLEDLTSWAGYRDFMKERLKQIPDGDCPFYISKQKVEFDEEGKRWKGYAVLIGPRGELAAKALKKDGVMFREGTCRQQGKELAVHGVPSNLVKSAGLTLQKLRLGYSLSGGTEGEGEPEPEEGREPAPPAADLEARLRETVAEVKEAAALKEPANADVLKQAALKARDVESAFGKRDHKLAERLLDEIDELLTQTVEGPEPAGDEDPDLAGLGDWQAYRQFLRAHLKRLPPEGGPFYVSRKKVEFSIEGKAFKGLAVLVGMKARMTVQALKKEGVLFKEGTCRKQGKELQVEGISMVLIKGARKTFLKLRLGRKLVPVGDVPPDEAEPEEGAPSQPDTEPLVNMVRPFEIAGSVGRGGKNHEDDVQQVQTALNRRLGAGLDVDGKCGPGTIKAIMEFQKALGQNRPDGLVEPRRGTARALAGTGRVGAPPPPPSPIAPPKLDPPSLTKAPTVWKGTRHILDTNIKELKRAIRQEYSNEIPELLVEIDRNVAKVDVILQKLDDRLGHSLDRANAARDGTARAAELKNAKAILADYIRYVKEETLIGHIDKNPFGVDTKLRKVITDSLTNMAKSIE